LRAREASPRRHGLSGFQLRRALRTYDEVWHGSNSLRRKRRSLITNRTDGPQSFGGRQL
jgi:hypothetical protein